MKVETICQKCGKDTKGNPHRRLFGNFYSFCITCALKFDEISEKHKKKKRIPLENWLDV